MDLRIIIRKRLFQPPQSSIISTHHRMALTVMSRIYIYIYMCGGDPYHHQHPEWWQYQTFAETCNGNVTTPVCTTEISIFTEYYKEVFLLLISCNLHWIGICGSLLTHRDLFSFNNLFTFFFFFTFGKKFQITKSDRISFGFLLPNDLQQKISNDLFLLIQSLINFFYFFYPLVVLFIFFLN